MTENEAIERLQTLNIILTNKAGHEEDGFEKIFTFSDITAICTAIQALEEIQQYRTIENKLKEIHGDWIDLLSFGEVYAEWVIQKNGGVPQKIVHLTDEHVDVWNEYKKIGTVEEILNTFNTQQLKIASQHNELEEYREIGTIEEFKALKEKMQDVEIMIIDRMQEFYDEYRRISQSRVDHFGGKADAIETSQKIVKGVFKDVLGIDWQ